MIEVALFTGSREWKKFGPVHAIMDGLALGNPNILFVVGCAKGLDAIVREYAKNKNYEMHVEYADWDTHGKAAGIIRNGEMVKFCANKNAVVFAFRTDGVSKGTDDCMEQSRIAGLPVYLMRNLPSYDANVKGIKGYRYNSEVEGP